MNGFLLFDVVHISWLSVILIIVSWSIYLYRRLPFAKQLSWRKGVFLSLLLFEIAKQLYYVLTDSYTYWSPPLHLCGLGIFIIGFHTYRPNKTTSTLLYALTLPGAAIALLFPGWANDPVGSFLHIHSFIFHALLVVYIAALLAARQLRARWQDLWRAVVFLLITVPPTYLYNARFGTNFMFLNRPVKGTPLQVLYNFAGAGGYIVSLCGVLAVVWLILYSLKWVK